MPSYSTIYVIRYAEVLLSFAETMVEKGNYAYSDVTELINTVRGRVSLPLEGEEEVLALNQDELRLFIRHERRLETAFEGLRIFDLYRLGEFKNAVDKINAEATDNSFWYEYRNYRGDMEYVWPIPLHELNANSKLVQHQLWE